MKNNSGLIFQPGVNSIEFGEKAAQLAQRLKYMLVGGRKLDDAEAVALAQFAIANDLSPFNGECYYKPGEGPIPGVEGYRRKAQDAAVYEVELLRKAGIPGGWGIELNFRKAEVGEAFFGPEDCAWVCEMTDGISRAQWMAERTRLHNQLVSMGVPADQIYGEVKAILGTKPPFTMAVGVVSHREVFTENGDPEKWDRNERAKKRAEKACYRKRFPKMILEDAELHAGGLEDLASAVPVEPSETPIMPSDVIEGNTVIDAQPKAKPSMNDLLKDLGFDPDTPPAPVIKPRVKTLADFWPKDCRYTYEDGLAMTTTDGSKKYVDLSVDELSNMVVTVRRYMEEHPETLAEGVLGKLTRRMDIAEAIMQAKIGMTI